MRRILITGGAGFVGANIAVSLKRSLEGGEVVCLDNLYRKGAELNLTRLEAAGVRFIRGDVRNMEDLAKAGRIDLLIECSAEPSVLAGREADGRKYLIDTNFGGAVNCAEYCLKHDAPMIFLSTSRIYPIAPLLECGIGESEKRFDFLDGQKVPGLSSAGVSEDFPTAGPRSFYGSTKYAAEVMLEEYRHAFSIPFVINRCGVIAGPWQFGKVDQGIATFWLAAHYFRKKLQYIGFGGSGKQVRDFLHIDDLLVLLLMQMKNPKAFSQGVYNVGGGRESSASLLELTEICAAVTGNSVEISKNPETRYADIPAYISDCAKIGAQCGWKPTASVHKIIEDIYKWLHATPEIHGLFR